MRAFDHCHKSEAVANTLKAVNPEKIGKAATIYTEGGYFVDGCGSLDIFDTHGLKTWCEHAGAHDA